MIEALILIAHILLALAIIGLVLLQQGKGADAGVSFGGGASQTVFGSKGSGSFLTRTTAILAALFFTTSIGLAIFAKQRGEQTPTIKIPAVTEQKQNTTEDNTIPEDGDTVENITNEFLENSSSDSSAEDIQIPE